MKRESELRPVIVFNRRAEDFNVNLSERVLAALQMAEEIHEGDSRKVSGEPYLNHCVAVASILESWGADEDEIIAGLLHDTVEDHPEVIDLAMIETVFGKRVAHLVDGVTKLKSREGERDEFETFRKITRESLIEPGVALIKLADRLHNSLEMEGMPAESQIRNATQTLKAFSPLAESFGLWQVKNLLEDLSFRYIDPNRYKLVKGLVDADPRLNGDFIRGMEKEINDELKRCGIEAMVEHQVGGYWEIAEKQKKFGMRGDIRPTSFSELTDLISFRVLTADEDGLAECYKAMGVIRAKYQGRLIRQWHNDYLVEPATNGYSCIHDSFRFPEGNIEIAFTTVDRERFNNWGVASLKKEELARNPERYARKLMFTPKQELVFMKPSAKGIDVAYKLNPLLGLRAIGIKIDGQLARLEEVVPHASLVEIVVDPHQTKPDPRWMEFCSERTRKFIEQQLAVVERDGEVQRGKEILTEKVLKERGILDLSDLDSQITDRLLMNLGCWYGLPDLYYKVAYGGLETELIKKKLEELGIVRGMFTTLLIRGENRIGIAKEVSQIMTRYGGDARSRVEKVDEKERFFIRILMTIDYKGKKKVEEEIKKKYPESIVV